MFWKINDDEERRSFIFNHCERRDVKRRTTNIAINEKAKKNKTVKYFLTDSNDQSSVQNLFLTTLGYNKINDKFLTTILSAEKGAIAPKKSMRGRQPSVNKVLMKLLLIILRLLTRKYYTTEENMLF